MHTYKDGLNYVPLLTAHNANNMPNGNGMTVNSRQRRSSTPISPRRGSIICYNGNYEGDLTMFGSQKPLKPLSQHRHRLELVETDSDTEYKRELETYQPQPSRSARTTRKSQLGRLLLHYCDRLVTPVRRKQATAYASRLYHSTHYQRICELICRACAWMLWLMSLVLFSLLRLANGTHGCWRSCVLLRNSARRLLWWMTLAKCGDMKLFLMILLGTPLLFIVAFVGFFLSIYSAVRDCVSNSSIIRRFRVI